MSMLICTKFTYLRVSVCISFSFFLYLKWDRLDGVALVLDLTSSTALESASDWLNLAKGSMISSQQNKKHVPPSDGSGDQTGNGSSKRGGGASGSDQSFLGVLIGSKTDLKDQRVISPKAAQDFASQHGLQYFECSAVSTTHTTLKFDSSHLSSLVFFYKNQEKR